MGEGHIFQKPLIKFLYPNRILSRNVKKLYLTFPKVKIIYKVKKSWNEQLKIALLLGCALFDTFSNFFLICISKSKTKQTNTAQHNTLKFHHFNFQKWKLDGTHEPMEWHMVALFHKKMQHVPLIVLILSRMQPKRA